ncbi:MAG TPA: hypothetical protein VF668_21305 [Pyrinomonadaceae bacterium]|jgi:hypothetical protein
MRPTHFDRSARPLREMFDRGGKVDAARGGRDFEPGRPQPVGNTMPGGVDPLVERNNVAFSAYAQPRAATTGVGIDPAARVAPPDTTGDLGRNHYVQWVNLRYAIYSLVRDPLTNQISNFALLPGFPKNGNVLWQGFGGPCETMNDGDPIVQYDQFADRWVMTQFAVAAQPFTQCVAVSTSPDPTGTYYRYAYSFGRDFNDFPKMGVWRDGYYITYNMFRGGRTFSGSNVCALERDKMLVGAAARQICTLTASAHSLEPADIEGPTLPAAGSANPLLSIGTSSLQAWRYSVNWTAGTSALTGPFTVPGVSFSRACGGGTCIPQAGTTQQLDSMGDRLNYRLSYRNFGTHESMVINHAVATGGTSGIRWYELRNAAGQTLGGANPVLYQQGTFSPDSTHRWLGSAAIDKTGGIAVGYNVSSASVRPSIRYAYRAAGDPLGALGNETSAFVGPGSQTSGLSRWGDYSTLSVDPVDGCTMVFTTEYQPANGTFNWATYIYSFKLSTCQ